MFIYIIASTTLTGRSELLSINLTSITAKAAKRSEISMQLCVDLAIEKQDSKQIHLNEYFPCKNKSDMNATMIGYSKSSKVKTETQRELLQLSNQCDCVLTVFELKKC